MAASFPIGSKVILQNLIKGSKYNGKRGIIKSNPDGANDGRQQVLLHDEHKILGVKPKNLKLIEEENSRKIMVPPNQKVVLLRHITKILKFIDVQIVVKQMVICWNVNVTYVRS